MSLFKEGKSPEAHELFQKVAATMKPVPSLDQIRRAHHDDLVLWLAYKEAEAMLNDLRPGKQ